MWAVGFVCLVYNPEQNTHESSKWHVIDSFCDICHSCTVVIFAKLWYLQRPQNFVTSVTVVQLYIYPVVIFAKVKRDSSCSCGLSAVDRTRIVNGAEAKVEILDKTFNSLSSQQLFSLIWCRFTIFTLDHHYPYYQPPVDQKTNPFFKDWAQIVTQAHSYPWIVAMMTGSGDYYCGGSIISNEYYLKNKNKYNHGVTILILQQSSRAWLPLCI